MTRQRIAAGLIGVALIVGGCGAPQIGPDEEAFKTVDALYTAVSAHDAPQLERCEADLKRLQSEGKLPEDAYRSLDSVVVDARARRWEPARQRLRDFMLAQRP